MLDITDDDDADDAGKIGTKVKKTFLRKRRGAQLINPTEKDIAKEEIVEMRKMIEKGTLDEEYRKETYQQPNM